MSKSFRPRRTRSSYGDESAQGYSKILRRDPFASLRMDSAEKFFFSRIHLGHEAESTPTHQDRLATVAALLARVGVTSVLDLGCGAGALLQYLVTNLELTKLVGVDASTAALAVAKQVDCLRSAQERGRLRLVEDSVLTCELDFSGFDAICLIEFIEHIAPCKLSKLEHKVFKIWQPRHVIVTTPNQDYNDLLGLAPGEFRHADHYFEWGRSKFISWANGVAARQHYQIEVGGLGPECRERGSLTQQATFSRQLK